MDLSNILVDRPAPRKEDEEGEEGVAKEETIGVDEPVAKVHGPKVAVTGGLEELATIPKVKT